MLRIEIHQCLGSGCVSTSLGVDCTSENVQLYILLLAGYRILSSFYTVGHFVLG